MIRLRAIRITEDLHRTARELLWLARSRTTEGGCPYVIYTGYNSSGSGGTGRHTILRGWRRKAWGFKSPLPHQISAYRKGRLGRSSGFE